MSGAASEERLLACDEMARKPVPIDAEAWGG